MKHLDVKQIEEIIPHRHPFLLVDYIEDYEPDDLCFKTELVSRSYLSAEFTLVDASEISGLF